MPFIFNPITNELDLYKASVIPPGGNVTGPGSSVTGDIAIFANSMGNVIADSGVKASNVLLSSNNLSDLVNPLAARTNLGLGSLATLNSPLGSTNGGTGEIAYTTGDILYASATNTLSKLSIGSSGQLLTVSGGIPSWISAPSTGVTSVSGTTGQIDSTGGTTPIISIDSGYVGQTSITTLGTITTGTWNSTLVSLAYGGTNADLTASNGGIFYSTATATAILSGTSTANQLLLSGSNAAPTWSTSTYPSSNAVNTLLYASSTNVMAALATANDGVFITSNTGVPSWLANASTSGYVLTANTAAPPSWQAASTNISGTANQITVTPSGATTTISLPSSIITPGSLTATTSLTATSGNITLTAGNLVLPANTSSSLGNVVIGSTTVLSIYGTNNAFGGGAGNFSLTTASSKSNTGFGQGVLTNLTVGAQNTAMGLDALNSMSNGSTNVAIGFQSGLVLTGSNNTLVGWKTAYQLLGGMDNTIIGQQSGSAYTSTETNNIILGYEITGTVSESNVIRIGNSSQTACYIAGIEGITAIGSPVGINQSTGQLSDLGYGTTNYAFVSNGSGVSPTWKILPVAGGGTGNSSQLAYSLICGGTTSTGAFQAVADVAVGSILISGGTSALPSFSAYPQVTGLGIGASAGSTAGLTFDGANFLDNYAVGTWTPTLNGATSGTTTYTTQDGYYVQIGTLILCTFKVAITAATGTGNAEIGGLPFAVSNVTAGSYQGAVSTNSAWTWPIGSTSIVVTAQPGNSFMLVECSGSAINDAPLQMANSACTIQGTLVYQT
jgi:hypothetical protein